MSSTGDSPRDKQQLADMTADYRALLTMTRPLVVTEHTLPAWRGGEVYRSGFGISPRPGDQWPESTISRGEVFRSDGSDRGMAHDEERAVASDEMETGYALQMRICIGLS